MWDPVCFFEITHILCPLHLCVLQDETDTFADNERTQTVNEAVRGEVRGVARKGVQEAVR